MRVHQNDQAKLLELARIDADHARLQHTATNMPEQLHLKRIEAERQQKRIAAAEAFGALEDARAALRRTEDEAATVADRRALDEERLAGSSSTKEIAALERDLEAVRRRQRALDDLQLEQMADVEAADAEHAERRREHDELEALAADLLERREQARAHIREEAKRLHEARTALTGGLDADLVAHYEQIRARAGIGACELVGTVSQATQETLGAGEMERIRKLAPDELAYCPASGAILVRTARSSLQ
ncbi:MAG: hypothetical protein GXX90_09860 [Microbacteriaceae bacterium]|nr:hypothetical protein [Microbacteriaceae bacterium]